MATEEFKVDPQCMARARTALTDCRGRLRQINNDMDGDIVSMSAQWQGGGGNAFRRANNAWVQKAEQMNKTLDDLEVGLGMTERKAQETDSDVAATAGTDLSALDGVAVRR